MDKRVNSPRGFCSKVKTLTSLEDNHMTTASCWQQLQIGHSLIKDSFCVVVYFVYNFLFGCLRASTNNRGDECSGGVGHVDEEPRLAGCHVLNSLSVMRLQVTTFIFHSFLSEHRFFLHVYSRQLYLLF